MLPTTNEKSMSVKRAIVALAFLFVPIFAHAQAPTFQSLLKQLAQLQAQLAQLQNQQGSTPTQTTSAASCPNLTRNLSRNSRGADVTQLQNVLIQQGHLESGNNTGFYGALTESAVKEFQCKHVSLCSGSPASNGYGAVGPKTRAAIQTVCGATPAHPTSSKPAMQPSVRANQSTVDALNEQLRTLMVQLSVLGGNTGTSTASAHTNHATDTTHYSQAAYYNQGTYYSEASYYSQAAYTSNTSTSSQASDQSSCNPVRKYTYTIPSDVALTCTGNAFVQIFKTTVADSGKALVRAKLKVKGTGTVPGLHGWSAYSYVGAPIETFQTGDGVCATHTTDRQIFGYGTLSSAAQEVALYAQAYRSTDCQNGAVTIGAGSVVEVWVEDAAPQCVGKDITTKSYRRTNGDVVKGITTTAQSLLSNTVAIQKAGTLRVMGQTELTVSSTYNTCGAETEIAYAYPMRNGTFAAPVSAGFSAAQGLSHVLLSPEYAVSVSPGEAEIGIGAAVNNAYRAAIYPLSEIAGIPGHYLGTFMGYPETGDTFVTSVLER